MAAVDSGAGPPTDDGATSGSSRTVEAALSLLEHTSAEQLTAYLRDDPAPAVELLRAVLPAAVGLSAALVGDADTVTAASERLRLCITVVQLLLPAASPREGIDSNGAQSGGADKGGGDKASVDGVSALRTGLRELLPVLVAASNAPLLPADARASALAASVGVATLRGAHDEGADTTNGGDASSVGDGVADEADRAALREAAEEMVGVHVPLRAKGLDTIRRLVTARRPVALSQLPLLVELCEAQLRHEDSYVYQAAVNTLEGAACVAPSMVLPRLAALLLPDPSDGGGANDAEIDAAAERRLKAAQAICQSVLRLGEAVPPHAEAVMGALLIGACDGQQPAVRSSCLACLAHVTATLRFALHPWAVEVLQVAGAALEGETDAEARRGSCYLLTTLLESLGTEALVVLPATQLAALHRRLRQVRDGAAAGGGAADEQLWGHACAALEALRALGSALAKGAARDDAAEAVAMDGLQLPSAEGYAIRMPGGGAAKPVIEMLGEALAEARVDSGNPAQLPKSPKSQEQQEAKAGAGPWSLE